MDIPFNTTSPWTFPDTLTDTEDTWLLLAGQIRDKLVTGYSSEEFGTDWRIRTRERKHERILRRMMLHAAYELEIDQRAKQIVDSECSAETLESAKLWVWMNFRLMSLGQQSLIEWLCHFDNDPISQKNALEILHRDAIAEAFKARELPRGWEPYFIHVFPLVPIKTSSDLHIHANMFLDIIRDCMQSSSCIPEWLEDESLRCLRNSRRALRDIGMSPPSGVNERCGDIYDVERQFEELVAITSAKAEIPLPNASCEKSGDQAGAEQSAIREDNSQIKVVERSPAEFRAFPLSPSVDDNPPEELLHKLSRSHAKILTYLWRARHATNWWSLPDDCWRTGATLDQTKRAVESALERLRDALNASPEHQLTLEVRSSTETVSLVRNLPRK